MHFIIKLTVKKTKFAHQNDSYLLFLFAEKERDVPESDYMQGNDEEEDYDDEEEGKLHCYHSYHIKNAFTSNQNG